jgi:molybdate transport system substrate-binding protein
MATRNERRPMLRTALAGALLLAPTAALADITVLTSGGTLPALQTLAEQWTKQTGKKVTIVGGTVAFTRDNVVNRVAGDLAVLPLPQFQAVSAHYRAGTTTPIGRVQFALAQKAGQPRPDISTLPKFISVLKAGDGVGYTDPNLGSAAGQWVSDLLARPEYAGVKRRPTVGMPGLAIARDGAQYALGPVSEEVTIPGVEVVGLLPKEIAMHFDYSAAVLAVAAQPEEAAQFLAFVTRPEARDAWKKTGVDSPS